MEGKGKYLLASSSSGVRRGEKEASSLLPAIKRINVGLKNGSLGGREIGNNTPPLTKSGLPIPRDEYFFPAKKEGENMGKS